MSRASVSFPTPGSPRITRSAPRCACGACARRWRTVAEFTSVATHAVVERGTDIPPPTKGRLTPGEQGRSLGDPQSAVNMFFLGMPSRFGCKIRELHGMKAAESHHGG